MIQQRKGRFIKVGNRTDNFQRYPKELDAADSTYAANYIIQYFSPVKDAAGLMRLQKESDLKEKSLWDNYENPFLDSFEITDDNFGVNVYVCGQPNDNRNKQPEYLNLLDLTSSHINYGGWQCTDFVVTLTKEHNGAKLIEDELPTDEFIAGWIRLDSGAINSPTLSEFLGIKKLTPDFSNAHLLTAKVVVPSQPFGRLMRGGKLISLLAASNDLRDYFNKKYQRNVVVFYTHSLYGSSKKQSQYDQLDSYLKFIGETEAAFSQRMKEPHKENLLVWMDKRVSNKLLFKFKGSSKADRSFAEMVRYVRWCLWKNISDKTCRELLTEYDKQIEKVKNTTEVKRCYVSTYGMPEWDENLINTEFQVNEEYNLDNLFKYWKKKVFKGDWGMRQTIKKDDFKMQLGYELLNEQLKDKEFNQVR